MVLLEGGEILRLLVFGDVEGGGGQAVDRIAVAVVDGEIGEDETGSRMEGVGGGRLTGGIGGLGKNDGGK